MLYEKTLNDAVPCFAVPAPVKTVATNLIDHSKMTDQLLWDAFKKGDERAFIRIYNSYSRLLYHYGCKFTQDKEMVRDCLQDFFLYLRNNKMGFGDISSIRQ